MTDQRPHATNHRHSCRAELYGPERVNRTIVSLTVIARSTAPFRLLFFINRYQLNIRDA